MYPSEFPTFAKHCHVLSGSGGREPDDDEEEEEEANSNLSHRLSFFVLSSFYAKLLLYEKTKNTRKTNDGVEEQYSRLKSSMPFKRDLALQIYTSLKTTLQRRNSKLKNEDVIRTFRCNMPVTRTNKRMALSLQEVEFHG